MPKYAVTGAFGYSGKYVARKLLARGCIVITLTNSPHKTSDFGEKVKAFPFSFDNLSKLVESLNGVESLINTYWVRFDHKLFTHKKAVDNTKTLFNAAAEAGVKKIVHVSITNPDLNSDLPYFSGKAELEQYLINSGISYSILRPTVIFGNEDILINNIAWIIRHFPIVPVFGKGDYKLQPIYVEDLAELAVKESYECENRIINAIGPETFTYFELLSMIIKTLGVKRKIIKISPEAAFYFSKILGFFLNDVLLTKEEIKGLMRNLLYVNSAPVGTTLLSDWIRQNKNTLGIKYASEMSRRR